MLFSKVELRHEADRLARAAHMVTQDGYRLHQALWQLFQAPPGTPRDFLYRRLEMHHWPSFYVISHRQPVDSRGVWMIQSKTYTPQLTHGQRLAFALCANPVITKPGAHGKPMRHDVVMNAKQQQDAQEESPVALGTLIQQVGRAWLIDRAERCGFHLEQVRVDGYRQHQFSKARAGQRIRFSTLDFNGLLTVVDAERFRHTLFHGLGPAKGFGCGLLLIRRV
jgi:CRISPR system Cascade subunit CasE